MNEDILLAWGDLDKIINEREPVKINYNLCCLHAKIIYNPSDQAMVCLECAEVLESEKETCEWNNHKKDDGSFQNSNQRGDANVSDNVYLDRVFNDIKDKIVDTEALNIHIHKLVSLTRELKASGEADTKAELQG